MSELTLGALAEWGALELNDGYRTKRVELGQPGLPILRVAEVLEGRIAPAFGDHVRDEFRPKIGRKVSMSGDVVVTTKGTVGRVAQMSMTDAQFVYSPQVCYLRVLDRSVLDAGWLYQWAKGPEFRRQVLSVQDQTDMAAYVNLADLRAMRITVPPLTEQRAIAEVLGALDDKIDADRRLAQCAYNYAVEKGGALVAEGEGPWVPLEQVAEIRKGVSYRSSDLAPGNGWLVSLKCAGRDGLFHREGLKPFIGVARENQLVDTGDVIVAQTDLTQRAEVIGRPIRVSRPRQTAGRMVASLDFVVVRPRMPLTEEVLLALLSRQEFREHVLGYCNGTTVLHMNARAAPSFQLHIPGADRIAETRAIMGPNLNRADVAIREAEILSDLRDALLPKLLSGELRVRDAEPVVEEHV